MMAIGLFERAVKVVRHRNEPIEEMQEFSRAVRQMARADGRPASVLIEDARFLGSASKWLMQETVHYYTRETAIGFVLATLAECA